MSQKTDLNISPYYDDFSESKNFHKVLFRAGRPVQARELTQSQSLLQNQVQRFGDHMFKEGSIVNGAETDIDMDVEFVKVEATNPNGAGTADVSSFIADFKGKIILYDDVDSKNTILSSSFSSRILTTRSGRVYAD